MNYNLQGIFSANELKEKTFTIVGMSGSGKTALSHVLSADGFFHYSIDYEIAHTHLKEKIRQSVIEKIKNQSQFFKELSEKFAIKVDLSLTFDDLAVTTMFVIPMQENGKVNFGEFLKNQEFYRNAEFQATMEFQSRAKVAFSNYDISGFINDTTGSICEVVLPNNELLEAIKNYSTVIYIQTTDAHRQMLVERSETAVKPILYNYDFLIQNMQEYYGSTKFASSFEIDKEFFLWVFPNLLEYRKKNYMEFIERTNGKVVDVARTSLVHNVKDFMDLVR